MDSIYRSLLVGAHFRPPAKVVLENLPAGAPLVLEPEPSNPHDEYAIKVLVRPEAVPQGQLAELREKCFQMGSDWDELALQAEPIFLGYIISPKNKTLGAWIPNTVIADVIAESNWEAKLGFSEEGKPIVLTVLHQPEDPPPDAA